MNTLLPLGYKTNNQTNPIGFKAQIAETNLRKIIYDNSEASLLTIAPTGSGKGRSNIIPTCLKYKGSLIVLDIKGEAAKVTANARKKFGEVYIVDPFKKITREPAKFNPFDIVLDLSAIEQQGAMIASALQPDAGTFSNDPFWDNMSFELLTAACIYSLETDRKFSTMRDLFYADDIVYKLAVLLDNKKIKNKMAHEILSSFIQTPDITRGGILSTTRQHLGILGSDDILDSLDGPSSFDIHQLLAGTPAITIYFVIPPNKISAYSNLLRLWMTSLMHLITEREVRPKIPTLMIIDECANLGKLDGLVSAITLMRCFGLKLWCFFQSISQIKEKYKNDWMTIIDNCDVIQAFGFKQYMSAKEMADVIGGISAAQLLKMNKDNAILMKAGEPYQVMRKLDYLKDKFFRNSGFEKNPFYEYSKL